MADTITDTITIDIDSEMEESHAISTLNHLIKHDYTVTEYNFKNGLKDSLSYPDYAIQPKCIIRAKKIVVIHPEPPKLKVDELIRLFNNAVDTLRKEGKISIEIDQGVGAIDIRAWAEKYKEQI